MEKYGRTGLVTDDSIIQPMRFACWVTKATNTHSGYVILIAFLQEQWLCRHASVLTLYIHCLSCFSCVSLKLHKSGSVCTNTHLIKSSYEKAHTSAVLQGGSDMTGINAACLHTNQSRSYLNHLV
jgi:hypothetical protein